MSLQLYILLLPNISSFGLKSVDKENDTVILIIFYALQIIKYISITLTTMFLMPLNQQITTYPTYANYDLMNANTGYIVMALGYNPAFTELLYILYLNITSIALLTGTYNLQIWNSTSKTITNIISSLPIQCKNKCRMKLTQRLILFESVEALYCFHFSDSLNIDTQLFGIANRSYSNYSQRHADIYQNNDQDIVLLSNGTSIQIFTFYISSIGSYRQFTLPAIQQIVDFQMTKRGLFLAICVSTMGPINIKILHIECIVCKINYTNASLYYLSEMYSYYSIYLNNTSNFELIISEVDNEAGPLVAIRYMSGLHFVRLYNISNPYQNYTFLYQLIEPFIYIGQLFHNNHIILNFNLSQVFMQTISLTSQLNLNNIAQPHTSNIAKATISKASTRFAYAVPTYSTSQKNILVQFQVIDSCDSYNAGHKSSSYYICNCYEYQGLYCKLKTPTPFPVYLIIIASILPVIAVVALVWSLRKCRRKWMIRNRIPLKLDSSEMIKFEA